MKKVLALVLVATLAIGMSVGSFAAGMTNIKGFDTSKTLADGVEVPTGATLSNQTVNLGDRYAMDKFKMNINLKTGMFGGGVYAENRTVYYALDTAKFLRSDLFVKAQTGPVTSWNDVKKILDDAAGASPTQLNTTNVTNVNDWIMPNTVNDSDYEALLNNYKSADLVQELSSGTVSGALYFTDRYNNVMSEVVTDLVEPNLTADEIRRSKIALSTSYKANSNTIKEIKLNNKEGRIEFKLVEEWVSTGSKDFEVHVFLTFDGKRADTQGLTIIGTMKNPEVDIDADHDYVDISEGRVINAVEFNSKIAVNVGNGATIHTKLFKNKKYYGITTRDNDEAADRVFSQYRDVDNVLTFKTVGLNSSYDYVTLSTDYSGYYVYDENMNYLGRGDEKLAFSKKFYLANRQLDLVNDDEEEEWDYTEPPVTGGDGSASGNVNANPGTGR